MTFEQFMALLKSGQLPAMGFGGVPAAAEAPVAPVAPVAMPAQTMPAQAMPAPAVQPVQAVPTAMPMPQPAAVQAPQMGNDWRQMAAMEAQKLLAKQNEPKQQGMGAPLGMMLMGLGEQLQTPPYLRGQKNTMQQMASSLLQYQMMQQQQQERNDYRKAKAFELLGKLSEPKSVSVVPERGAVYDPSTGEYRYPEVSPARRAEIESQRTKEKSAFDLLSQKYGQEQAMQMMRNQHTLRQIEARGNIERPGSFEMVETENGPAWVQKGKSDITPIPGARMKAKAGSDADARYKAMKLTEDQGVTPDDPNYDTRVTENLGRIQGKKLKSGVDEADVIKALNPGLGTGQTRTYNGKKYKVVIRNGVPGIDTSQPVE